MTDCENAIQGQVRGLGDWVLVPRVPTDAMLRAAQGAWLNDPLRRTTTMWAAMLAAAPQQPAAVDEAMVERACKAFLAEIWPDTYEEADDLRAMIRRILSAALAAQPGGAK